MPFTPRAKRVLEQASEESVVLAHTYVGTEHILLALTTIGEGVGMMRVGRSWQIPAPADVPPTPRPEDRGAARYTARMRSMRPVSRSGVVTALVTVFLSWPVFRWLAVAKAKPRGALKKAWY